MSVADFVKDLLKAAFAQPGGVGASVSTPVGSFYSVDAERAAAVAKLRAACDQARYNPAWRPGQPNPADTHCNGNADEVARAFGYTKLAGLHANDQISVLSSDMDWEMSTDPARFGAHAMKGGLAFATVIEYPHGHICPGYPEPPQPSNAWGGMEPMVSNIGKHVAVDRLSDAFLLHQKPMLRFYLFKAAEVA